MEKKRKHPNFIDIAFILLIAAVALTAYFLSHRSSANTIQTVPRTYVIELNNLEPHMADCVSVGSAVTDNVKNYAMGTVTAVEAMPYTISSINEDEGKYVQSEVPGKITLHVTVQAETIEDAKGISTDTGYSLRIGTSVSCTINSLTASGYIINLER